MSYVVHGLPGNVGKTFDILLELTANGTSITDGLKSKVVELGTGLMDADLVLDIEAEGGGAGFKIELSADKGFTTPVETISVAGPLSAGTTVVPFTNSFGMGIPYGFIRLTWSGTAKGGAFIAKK